MCLLKSEPARGWKHSHRLASHLCHICQSNGGPEGEYVLRLRQHCWFRREKNNETAQAHCVYGLAWFSSGDWRAIATGDNTIRHTKNSSTERKLLFFAAFFFFA